MTWRPISRRDLMLSSGASLIAWPFLRARNANAQNGPYPKRLMIFFSGLGTLYDAWKPNIVGPNRETDFTMSPILMPLAPYKNDLLILDGIDLKIAFDNRICDHAAASAVLTGEVRAPGTDCIGFTQGMSVDQFVADRISTGAKFKSMELIVTSTGEASFVPSHQLISQRGTNAQIMPQGVPRLAFERFFGEMLLDKNLLVKIKAQRKSSLDVLGEEIKALQNQLDREDVVKLDAHLTSIREIEKKVLINDSDGDACDLPQIDPTIPRNGNNAAFATKIPETTKAQLDIIATAFACDLTRVATLNLFSSSFTHTWTGSPTNHHELSHLRSDPDPRPKFIRDKTWTSEMFAYFLAKLKAIPEGNGNVLDNTMVVWASEMGEPMDHHFENVPFIIAGKAGGALRTGRYLQYGAQRAYANPSTPQTKYVWSGVNHNRLLISICHAMGLNNVSTFGQPAYCVGGPLDRLT